MQVLKYKKTIFICAVSTLVVFLYFVRPPIIIEHGNTVVKQLTQIDLLDPGLPESPDCVLTEPIFDPTDKKYGLNRADDARWKISAGNEFGLWKSWQNRKDADDRAEQHKTCFDDYKALPDDLGDVMELGCGPYTQLETILRTKPTYTTKTILLVDPMIDKYLTLNNCRYKDLRLSGKPVSLLVAGAEAVTYHEAFDTIVIINVLEHVMDSEQILRNTYNALRPGGIVIFHDRTWDNKPLTHPFDNFHHIRIYHNALEMFGKLFEHLWMRDDKDPTHDWASEWGQANSIYMIGRKPSNCKHVINLTKNKFRVKF